MAGSSTILNGDKANDKKNYNFGLNLKIVPTDRFTIKIYGDLFHRQDNSLDELFIPKSRFGNISKSEAKHIKFRNSRPRKANL
jgi:tonB-dependent receptor protein